MKIGFSTSVATLLALAACFALLAARGWLFDDRLRTPQPPTPLQTPAELTIYYHERRPYYFAEDGRVRGIVADRAAEALARANIRCRWAALPPARQLQQLRDAAYAAGVGWIFTEERLKFAHYSAPLWQDGPFVAIARRDDSRLSPGRRLEELFSDSQLTLLLKDSYSYGLEVDALLERLRPPHVRTPSPNELMLQMIAERRADYFLLASEEAAVLVQGDAAGTLRIVELAGAPRGVVRHLLFSRRVPEEIVARFDAALHSQRPAK